MRSPDLPRLLFLCLSLSVLRAEPIELFNGRNLDGWRSFQAANDETAEPVFSVTEAGNLLIAGHPKGYLRTNATYANYRLVVEWRWVDKPANSGVLLHTQEADRIWPLCVEAQLQSQRAGDIIFIGVGSGGTFGDASALVVDADHPYHAAKRLSASSEKPAGEWNRYEILAEGSNLELRVNGVRQNRATDLTLTSGAICLQSEGGPIEFRRVTLEPLAD